MQLRVIVFQCTNNKAFRMYGRLLILLTALINVIADRYLNL